MNRVTTTSIVGVLLALTVAACSLVVERGSEQCSTDASCVDLFGAGATCSASRVCLTAGQGGGCTSNSQCSNQLGAAAICRKDQGKCVALLSADCPRLVGVSVSGSVLTDRAAIESDDTILLGSLTALKGANQSRGEARVNATELAAYEVMSNAGGLLYGNKARPVAFLSCNDFEDQTPAPPVTAPVRASRHLVDDLGVAAIIGGSNSGPSLAEIPETAKKGTLLIAPSTTSATMSDIDDDGLFWRTCPSDDLQALALRAVALDVFGLVKTARSLTKVKVAMLYKADAYGQGLQGAVEPKLSLNGSSITSTNNQPYYLSRSFDPSADLSSLVTEVTAFAPDVVILFGTNEAVTKLLRPIEAAAPNVNNRPFYVMPAGAKGSELLEAVDADAALATPTLPPLRNRVIGTAPGRPNAITNGFVNRFNARFSTGEASSFGTAGAYDAAYVLFYAISSLAPDEAITGSSIAGGIGKLLSGKVNAVGPLPTPTTSVSSVFNTLAAGGTVDLDGAASPLKFDAKGDTPGDIEVWCVRSAGTPAAAAFETQDKWYDYKQGDVLQTDRYHVCAD